MTLTALILTAAVLTVLAWGVRYLYDFVANDGAGHLTVHDTPPRSHPRDLFESAATRPRRLNTSLYPR